MLWERVEEFFRGRPLVRLYTLPLSNYFSIDFLVSIIGIRDTLRDGSGRRQGSFEVHNIFISLLYLGCFKILRLIFKTYLYSKLLYGLLTFCKIFKNNFLHMYILNNICKMPWSAAMQHFWSACMQTEYVAEDSRSRKSNAVRVRLRKETEQHMQVQPIVYIL